MIRLGMKIIGETKPKWTDLAAEENPKRELEI